MSDAGKLTYDAATGKLARNAGLSKLLYKTFGEGVFRQIKDYNSSGYSVSIVGFRPDVLFRAPLTFTQTGPVWVARISPLSRTWTAYYLQSSFGLVDFGESSSSIVDMETHTVTLPWSPEGDTYRMDYFVEDTTPTMLETPYSQNLPIELVDDYDIHTASPSTIPASAWSDSKLTTIVSLSPAEGPNTYAEPTGPRYDEFADGAIVTGIIMSLDFSG